jgi:hypothetical protein
MPKAKTGAAKPTALKTISSKTAAKTSVPTRAAPLARAARLTKAVEAPKPAKLRQKPVRDSFTMPETDFALIAMLKARALAAQRETKKSELLRAGLHVLTALDTPALLATLGKLDQVKVGRPKKHH